MRPCHLRSATWPKQTRKPWDYINKCVFLRMLGTKMCPEAAEMCRVFREQDEDEEEPSFSGGAHREGRCSRRGVAEGLSRFKIRKKKIK